MKYLIVVLTLVLVAPTSNADVMEEVVVWGDAAETNDNMGGWEPLYSPVYADGLGEPAGSYEGGGGGGTGTSGDGSDGDSEDEDEDEGEPIPEIIVVGYRLTVFVPDPDDLLEPDAFIGSIMTELSERASLAIEELASTVDDMTLAEACEAAEMAVYDVCLREAQKGYMICTAGSTAVSLFASIFVSAASDFLCDTALDNIVAHCDAGEFPSPLGGYSTDQFNIVGCP